MPNAAPRTPVDQVEPVVTTTDRRRSLRLPPAPVLFLAAFLLAAVAYVVTFGGCDTQSKFCHVGLAGTRSEMVVAWLDEFEVYTQTAPSE